MYYNVTSSMLCRIQARIQDFTLGGGGGAHALLGERSGKLLGIRKYRTSFLNRNWLKLYHVRHDASHHIEGMYNEVWYFNHDVRPCYDFNMKNRWKIILFILFIFSLFGGGGSPSPPPGSAPGITVSLTSYIKKQRDEVETDCI